VPPFETDELKNIGARLEQFRSIVQFVPIGVFQIDGDDRYTFVNPAWEKITGCSFKNALGQIWWNVIHPDDRQMVFYSWGQSQGEGNELSVECRINLPGVERRWVRLRTNFLYHDTGKKIFGSLEDISNQKKIEVERENLIAELREAKCELEISSRTDPLTGLLNRRGMEEKLESEVLRFERNNKPFTLIMTDIDHFKKVNDTYGHDTGDFSLAQLARILIQHSRKQDVVCRWGGEEFLMLLPETPLRGGSALAEKLRSRIEQEALTFKNHKFKLTLSLGIACIHEDQNLGSCIKHADVRLYLAKQRGRNQIVWED